MSVPCTCSLKAEKSGFEATAAISLLMILPTNEVTTEPNAAPSTTATARSITLPRRMNCLNPLNMESSLKGRNMISKRGELISRHFRRLAQRGDDEIRDHSGSGHGGSQRQRADVAYMLRAVLDECHHQQRGWTNAQQNGYRQSAGNFERPWQIG